MPEESASHHTSRQDGDMALIPSERASKIIGTQTLDVKFGDLDPEILKSKGGPGASSGGPPLGAVWRPMLTWRRMLRTSFLGSGPATWGAPSGRGRGVRSTLLQVTLGISCCDLCSECVVPGASPNNPGYPRVNPREV